jgi:hypothetical protein
MSSVGDTISIARSGARSPKPSGSLPSGKLCLRMTPTSGTRMLPDAIR